MRRAAIWALLFGLLIALGAVALFLRAPASQIPGDLPGARPPANQTSAAPAPKASPPVATQPPTASVPPSATRPPKQSSEPPAAGGTASGRPSAPLNTVTVRVFFGTDRRPSLNNQPVFADAEALSAGQLSLGWCEVSIPRLVHSRGEIERPTIWTLDTRRWVEDANLHFVIQKRRLAPEDEFWSAAQSDLKRARSRDVMLFVHGYNVAFDDAIYRTAQLAFDLKQAGIPFLYSWPSDGRTLRYVGDKDSSVASVPSFKRFLVELSRRSGAERVHVIAHSMGNLALVQALSQLQRELGPSAPHFRQVIMAAPDVDRRMFEGIAAEVQQSADRITLYAASNDRALGASEQLHGDPRIGDASPMYVRAGIDAIDASAMIKGFLRHSYFAEPTLLTDIGQLIAGTPALPRLGMIGIPTDREARYWALR
jgi:esterase/lipase superfamily enzyme